MKPIFAVVFDHHKKALRGWEECVADFAESGKVFRCSRQNLSVETEEKRVCFIVINSVDDLMKVAGYQFRHIKFDDNSEFNGHLVNYMMTRVRYVP